MYCVNAEFEGGVYWQACQDGKCTARKLLPLIGVIQAGREFYPQALQKHRLVR